MTTTELDLASIYETARAAWQPDADDNPENYWFYRSWEGFRAVCEATGESLDRFNGILHNSLCMSDGGQWHKVIANLTHYANKMEAPAKPERCYWGSYSKPEFRPERAKAIFDYQFKAKFPGKRLNSKFAKEHWVRVESKAMELAQAEFERKLADWQTQEDRRNGEFAKRLAEWQAKVDGIERCKAFIAKLTRG